MNQESRFKNQAYYLKTRRKATKMSQRQFAEEILGTCLQILSSAERGNTALPMKYWQRIMNREDLSTFFNPADLIAVKKLDLVDELNFHLQNTETATVI